MGSVFQLIQYEKPWRWNMSRYPSFLSGYYAVQQDCPDKCPWITFISLLDPDCRSLHKPEHQIKSFKYFSHRESSRDIPYYSIHTLVCAFTELGTA